MQGHPKAGNMKDKVHDTMFLPLSSKQVKHEPNLMTHITEDECHIF